MHSVHLRAALHITACQMHVLTGSVTVHTEKVSHVWGNCASLVALLMQVVQPDVVLVTYDALTSDISQLQPIEWEAIVVDERNHIQPSLSKAHQALRELDATFRLLLASGNPKVCSAHRWRELSCCNSVMVQHRAEAFFWQFIKLLCACWFETKTMG